MRKDQMRFMLKNLVNCKMLCKCQVLYIISWSIPQLKQLLCIFELPSE